MSASTIDGFDVFDILGLIDFPLTPSLAQHLGVSQRLAWLLPLEKVAMLRMDCEAVMWKITTRSFTLEELLIMAAMNLLTSADTAAKWENRTPQKIREDQTRN